jgi:hypothetical protein
MSYFSIKQKKQLLEFEVHKDEDYCKSGIIEYFFISEGVGWNKDEFPIAFLCSVPIDIMNDPEKRNDFLVGDCTKRINVNAEDLVLIYLVNGNIITTSSQEANEKICIYQIKKKKEEPHIEIEKSVKEEKEKEPEEVKKNKNVEKLKEKEPEDETEENEEQKIYILNIKNLSNIRIAYCIPFVFRCESSQESEEVFIYILL